MRMKEVSGGYKYEFYILPPDGQSIQINRFELKPGECNGKRVSQVANSQHQVALAEVTRATQKCVGIRTPWIWTKGKDGEGEKTIQAGTGHRDSGRDGGEAISEACGHVFVGPHLYS
jgi:hypothetical protein